MTYHAAALQQYRQVKLGEASEGATPHRLIQMLFDGALERIAGARGHLERGDLARKGEQIGKAIAIIGGLREGLDEEAGGEIARNLDVLYEYMQRRLVQANLSSDPAMLDEVSSLLREIKNGWDAIRV